MVVDKIGARYKTTRNLSLCGIIIPEGFDSDGASIPRCFRPVFIKDEYKYLIPAILHDYMYANQMGFFRANLYFYKAMRIYKVNPGTRVAFFIAVSLFGHYAYFIKHGLLKKYR